MLCYKCIILNFNQYFYFVLFLSQQQEGASEKF